MKPIRSWWVLLAGLLLSTLPLSGQTASPSEGLEDGRERPFDSEEPLRPEDGSSLGLPSLLDFHLEELEAAQAELSPWDETMPIEIPPPPPEPSTWEDEERQAATELRHTGRAAILARPTAQVFPFGKTSPTLLCLPDRACDLALEAGEVVDGLAVGDAGRWQVEQLFEGEGAQLRPHLVFRPDDEDLATNAVIVTNRRTYHLELRAGGADGDGDEPLYHHAAFWYPETWARRLRSDEVAAKAAGASRQVPFQELSPGRLRFRYEVVEPRKVSRRLGWVPRTVFDDGQAIYLVLPAEAEEGPLPVLLARSEGGELSPLNATFRDGWFVVPALVEEMELVLGTGKDRRWLRLRRESSPGVRP